MKNKQRQKEIEGEIKRRKKCRINVGKKKEKKSVSAFIAKGELSIFFQMLTSLKTAPLLGGRSRK